MADDKRGREKQARDAEDSRRERDIATELERGDEPEPSVDAESLTDVETALESVSFPATGAAVVAAVGTKPLEAAEGTYTVEELVAAVDVETFDSPRDVRVRLHRPTVAAAMKRIVEAAAELPNADLSGSQRDGYERTLRELVAIDADDEDEGVRIVTDWLVEQIRADGALPSSRSVRREAAKVCRRNGYQIRNDEWLGI